MAKKYIDAELLKKKIERLKGYISVTHFAEELLSFIDSLQQEQSCDTCTNDKGCVTCKDGELWEGKEQSSEDLEAEIKRYIPRDQCPVPDFMEAVARHFAEWQKEQMIRDCSVQASYEAEIEKAEERGYNLCKEQMLKDAVEGVAEEPYDDGTMYLFIGVGTYLMPGDEVYVIKKED